MTSIRERFGYLLHSKLFQAAVAVDPAIRFSFTDHQQDNKFFTFSSNDVKLSVKALIPPATANQSGKQTETQPPSKKKRLMDFCSISDVEGCVGTINDVDTEIEMYFAQPRLQINPIEFWTQGSKSRLSGVALEILSVPCSSAPVERLFQSWYCFKSNKKSHFE